MDNAQKIMENLDPSIVLMELSRNGDLWDENTFRQDFPASPHSKTKTILCRMTDELNNGEVDPIQLVGASALEAIDNPAYAKLPSVYSLVCGLMNQVKGERLGRIMVVKLEAGGSIAPHVDQGEYPKYYDRFHITLQSGDNGALYKIGDDKFRMFPGEIWWFQNLVEHEVINDSSEPRINIIVDIKLRGSHVSLSS